MPLQKHKNRKPRKNRIEDAEEGTGWVWPVKRRKDKPKQRDMDDEFDGYGLPGTVPSHQQAAYYFG
jgi:hypothetical protein